MQCKYKRVEEKLDVWTFKQVSFSLNKYVIKKILYKPFYLFSLITLPYLKEKSHNFTVKRTVNKHK